MRITVLLFARLRDIAGTANLHRKLPDGATARVLWKTLVQDFPEFDSYSTAISTAVNEEYSHWLYFMIKRLSMIEILIMRTAR